MGEMYFPGEIEKLYDRKTGALTERYKDGEGHTVEEHHRGSEGSPLMRRDILLNNTQKEVVYFDGETNSEKPYLRRVYEGNRLRIEEGLRGTLDKLSYRENYTYGYADSDLPSAVIHEDFDEQGNSLSARLDEYDLGSRLPKSRTTLEGTLKKSSQKALLVKTAQIGKANTKV